VEGDEVAAVTEGREIPGFKTIVLRGYGDLELHQDSAAPGPGHLSIEADEQIMPKILAEVRGDRLVLGFTMPWYDWIWWWWQWMFTADKKVRFRLTSAGVEALSIWGAGLVRSDRFEAARLELKVSGAGKVRLAGVAVKDLETRLSGAADIDLTGTTEQHDVHISGAGSVHALKLAAKKAAVSISGAGNCSLNVSVELDARISGAGNVTYLGNPRITRRVSGAGSVRQAR
jgi:hypothetical protein